MSTSKREQVVVAVAVVSRLATLAKQELLGVTGLMQSKNRRPPGLPEPLVALALEGMAVTRSPVALVFPEMAEAEAEAVVETMESLVALAGAALSAAAVVGVVLGLMALKPAGLAVAEAMVL